MINQQKYTGDILDEVYNRKDEYTAATQEITFTTEQHAIWADLFAGIYQPMFWEHVCREYIEGFERLQLNPLQIPSVAHLNSHITSHTNWKVERTTVRYTKADAWYQKFANRIFLITDYLRTRDQMEFTPEPDMFHDIFGHLPYLTLQFYADIEDKFAPAYFNATEVERESIKSLAWYTTEFGLVMEKNRIKIFGAGIISGRAEFANTVMELYRLVRDNVIDAQGDVYAQLTELFARYRPQLQDILAGVQELHQRGQMSSVEHGWNVVDKLYDELGIEKTGYLGGDVIIAPFDLEFVTTTPKTVYAFNPIFYVAPSFHEMDKVLDSYLLPIAIRSHIQESVI